MYKKYITVFLMASMVIASSWVCARELKINRIAAKPAFQMEYLDASMTEDKHSFTGKDDAVSTVGQGL